MACRKKAIKLEEVETQAKLLKMTYPHLRLLDRLYWLEAVVTGLDERFRQIELPLVRIRKRLNKLEEDK